MTRPIAVLLLLSLVLMSLLVPSSGLAAEEDVAIPGGRMFPQTGGFTVTDEAGVPLWREFQRLGGVAALGYPVSGRYEADGFVTQAMQKGILQWRADERRAVLTNVLDDLSRAGKDEWLQTIRSTPRPFAGDVDGGKPWPEIVKSRQALLDVDPAIKARYFSVADPLTFFGLPTSAVEDMGNHLAVRLQRAVIQRWKVDVPWARAGETTVANAGDLAKEAGLLPVAALTPSSPVVEARADIVPWSGWWWPADVGVAGPHLFDADGPLAKYDRLLQLRTGKNPGNLAWERANLRLAGGLYPWAGHCNGWAAAAILEPEPRAARTIDGVTFSVADQKGLLASWHFADNAEWLLGDDTNGVVAADFHRALIQWIGGARRPFIVNAFAGQEQVSNYPAYRYRLIYSADPANPARTHVRATVWFVDFEVPADFVGTRHWPSDDGRTYEYFIDGDRENPSGGAWEGMSATGAPYSRPWRIWYPNATDRNTDRPLTSPGLDYAVIREIVGKPAG